MMRMLVRCTYMMYFLLILTVISCGQSKDNVNRTYTNPLSVSMGDPFVLLAPDSTYYMYGTGGGAKDGFAVYSSKDLVDWENEGQVFWGNTDSSWSLHSFWAPEVFERNGKYYMFYSAQ